MASRRFTLAGLLLWITLIGLVLAIVVPLWRYRQRARSLGDRVTAIAMSADGSTAAAAMGDGRLFIWDATTGRRRSTINTGRDPTGPFVLSSDGNWAALSHVEVPTMRRGIEIWDVVNSKARQTLQRSWPEGHVEFSSTQSLLAFADIGGDGSLVTLYALDTGRSRQFANATSFVFSPDGDTLAMGGMDSVRVYDAETIALRDELPLEGAADYLAFSPDGRTLAVLEENVGPRGGARQIKTFDLATRASRQAPVEPAGHWRANVIAYLPGGHVVAVPEDFGLGILDASTLESLDRDETFSQLAAGLRGAHFLVANGGTVDLYDAATLQKVKRLLDANPKPNPLLPMAGLWIWLLVFFSRRTRRHARECAACGARFTPARKNDANTACPTCRDEARFKTLSAEQAASEQRTQSQRNWRNLLVLNVLVAAGVAMGVRDRFGLLPTFVVVQVALPALVFVAVRLLRKWVIVLPSNLSAEIAAAEKAAGAPGQVRHVGEVLVWSAEGASLADEFEPQLEATRQWLAEVTGRLVSPSAKLRVLLFADGDGVLRYLRELGFRLEDRAARRGIYISAPANRLCVGERDARVQEADPCFTLRWLIARHLIEQTGVHVSCAWLLDGLAGMIAYESSEHERASLNRRALAGIASGRTLPAEEWFAGAPTRKRRSTGQLADLQTYAWFRQFQTQSRSLMEFVCGQGATPEWRAAFQQLFNDRDLQKHPAETFEHHFGCPIDELFAQWRAWVEQQGGGEHLPPSPQVAEYLTAGPLAKISAPETPRRDRIEAIREWGERGYLFGAEHVIALLRGDDEELRAEAVYALECVSGVSLGTTAESWEAWAKQQSRPDIDLVAHTNPKR
ncbi:MAG TPA: hypothetical protein VF306_10550 [Pirellulales bacterium]